MLEWLVFDVVVRVDPIALRPETGLFAFLNEIEVVASIIYVLD
jgi:hypothetical protein